MKLPSDSSAGALAEDAEHVSGNLQRMIEDAERMISSSASHTGSNEKVAELRARLSDTLDRLKGTYKQAEEKVIVGAKRTDEVIRSHPYESLAIALGVGVLLGAFLRRND